MDEALERRITHQICFKRPDEATRLRLWETMLPLDSCRVDSEISYVDLAKSYALSGAEMRVAVLRAATVAASKDQTLTLDLLDAEIRTTLASKPTQNRIGFGLNRHAG